MNPFILSTSKYDKNCPIVGKTVLKSTSMSIFVTEFFSLKAGFTLFCLFGCFRLDKVDYFLYTECVRIFPTMEVFDNGDEKVKKFQKIPIGRGKYYKKMGKNCMISLSIPPYFFIYVR